MPQTFSVRVRPAALAGPGSAASTTTASRELDGTPTVLAGRVAPEGRLRRRSFSTKWRDIDPSRFFGPDATSVPRGLRARARVQYVEYYGPDGAVNFKSNTTWRDPWQCTTSTATRIMQTTLRGARPARGSRGRTCSDSPSVTREDRRMTHFSLDDDGQASYDIVGQAPAAASGGRVSAGSCRGRRASRRRSRYT